MTIQEATDLIRPGVIPVRGIWADIGAGTGIFTMALMEILEEGEIIALDKSPHALYSIKSPSYIGFQIKDADFQNSLHLPPLDGIIMANALHYAHDHLAVLKNVLTHLKRDGAFILIEYDRDTSNPPWVPFPVPLKRFKELCQELGLKEPEIIGRRKSIYQDGEMYVVKTGWAEI